MLEILGQGGPIDNRKFNDIGMELAMASADIKSQFASLLDKRMEGPPTVAEGKVGSFGFPG